MAVAEPYRRAIERAAAAGQVEREVASSALDRLRREPEDALTDAAVAGWLGVSESAMRSLKALAREEPALEAIAGAAPAHEDAPVPTLRVERGGGTARVAESTVDTQEGDGSPVRGPAIGAVVGPVDGAGAGLRGKERPPAPLPPLPVIPGFEVDSLIGRGGMGSVYRARQVDLGREVALKVLRPPEPLAAERFLREARAVASVQHPHVVTCYGAGRAGDLLYMALELVPGGDAERLVREHGRLPERRALSIVRDGCLGLAAIEARGLVHRDLKPANLLLDADGRAKIADLGLARLYASDDRLTQSGSFVGTPVYMAPEQACAEEVDVRADIYGLGATLYHLLTGAPPFAGHVMAILTEKASGRVPDPATLRPELGAPTRALVRKAMAHAPEERHASARDLLADLDRALEARAESVRSRSSRIRAASRWARWQARLSTPLAALAGGAALVAAIALGAAALRTRQGAARPWATSRATPGAAETGGPGAAPLDAGSSPASTSPVAGAPTSTDASPSEAAPAPTLASVALPALVPLISAKPSAAALEVRTPARLKTAGQRIHEEGGWYTVVSASAPWSSASLFGADPRRAPARADFHVQPRVSREASAIERPEQGFDGRGGFFYELGLRSDPREIASAGDLEGFAVWVTLVCDKADKARGLIRVVNDDKPAGDRALRVTGDAPTPGVAIVDRFEVAQVSAWGATEVWLRVEPTHLVVAIVRRGRKLYEHVRAWDDLPLAVADGPTRPLYLWAQMGNWGNGRGNGSLRVEVEAP